MIPLITSLNKVAPSLTVAPPVSPVNVIHDLNNQMGTLNVTSKPSHTLLNLPIDNSDAKIILISGDKNSAANSFKNIKLIAHLFSEKNSSEQPLPRKANFTFREGMKPASYILSLLVKEHFFADRPISNAQRKACLYHWVLTILAWETHFIGLLTQCIQDVEESAKFFENEYTLDSTEAFAFHIRFMNFLYASKTKQIGIKLFLKNTKAMPCGTHSSQLLRLHSRIFACLSAITQALSELETTFSISEMSIVLKRITPLLGFVATESIGHFQNITWLPGKVTTAHGLDSSWLSRIKDILSEYHRPYFTEQMMLYETVSQNLDELLLTHEFLRNDQFNFRRWNGVEGANVPTITDYERDTSELVQFLAPKNALETTLKPISQEELNSLLRDDEVKSNEPVKKGKAEKREKKRPQNTVKKPPVKPKELARVESVVAPISPIIAAVMQASPLRCHKRVLRWMTLKTSDVEKARDFIDYRDKKPVLLYQRMSLEDLKEQALFHGLCPSIDKVITHAEMQKKYALTTLTGYSLIVEIIRETRPPLRGVLSFALHNGFCYHRMFEERSQNNFFYQPIQELAKVRLLNTDPLELHLEAEEVLKQELESGFEGDTFDVNPRTEVISFLDRKNGCTINVFPLN